MIVVAMRRVRLWLLALVCFACGVTCRIVFAFAAPPFSRVDAMEQWSVQTLWYTAALLLAAVHIWRLGTTGRPYAEVPGCISITLIGLGLLLAYLIAVWTSLPAD